MGANDPMRTRRPDGPKHLVVVRHAKSSWDDPSLADHDRPLAPRGRRAIVRLRDHLEGATPPPDLVLCSTSRRTRQTLDGIRSALGDHVQVELERSLYGADADDLLRRLQRVDDRATCVALIGHNPGCEDLVDLLTDPTVSEVPLPDRFPTAAVASLSFTGPWSALRPRCASLENVWTPRGAST